MKLKKILNEQWVGVYLLIGVAALYFIYSLGFMSNFYRLFYDGNAEMYNFYKELQLLNKFIFNTALTTLILAILALPFDIHKKKTGWINVIFLMGFFGYELSNLSTIFGSIPYYTNKYMSFDYSIIENYNTTPIMFTLTYVFYLSILLILLLLILIFVLQWVKQIRRTKGVKPDEKG
jgi:hypothetical protein